MMVILISRKKDRKREICRCFRNIFYRSFNARWKSLTKWYHTLVGVSSALAYRGDVSCGGIDVFSYYFALRKSTNIGRYGIMINGAVITTYSILLVFTSGENWEHGVIAFFFSIMYLFVVNLVVDAINLRNKKVQVQIVTNSDYLTPVLIANFPHGATVTSWVSIMEASGMWI